VPPADRGPQPTLGDLDRLLDASRATGMPIARRDAGTPRELSATVGRTAYRIVQEALTNVHKHAADAQTDVRIHYLPDAIEVVVRNAAPMQRADPLPAGGFGLIGLRERVDLLGGRFEARPRLDGGFIVSATIPAEVAAAPAPSRAAGMEASAPAGADSEASS
jgi:signal transduction histidine kinase